MRRLRCSWWDCFSLIIFSMLTDVYIQSLHGRLLIWVSLSALTVRAYTEVLVWKYPKSVQLLSMNGRPKRLRFVLSNLHCAKNNQCVDISLWRRKETRKAISGGYNMYQLIYHTYIAPPQREYSLTVDQMTIVTSVPRGKSLLGRNTQLPKRACEEEVNNKPQRG